MSLEYLKPVVVFNKRINEYQEGKKGIVIKGDTIELYDDYVAFYYGFKELFLLRYKVKFNKKWITVKCVRTRFNNVGMYFYTETKRWRIRRKEELEKEIMSLARDIYALYENPDVVYEIIVKKHGYSFYELEEFHENPVEALRDKLIEKFKEIISK